MVRPEWALEALFPRVTMIRLRPHHLLCMLTFAGKGYTADFVANFEQVLVRIAAGNETIEIVEGPDDICAPLLTETECHCHNESVRQRDRQASEAISRLLQRPIQAGEQFNLGHEQLGVLRRAFAEGTIRLACTGCPWCSLCDGIAQGGFALSLLA
jgi:hypothetical protein